MSKMLVDVQRYHNLELLHAEICVADFALRMDMFEPNRIQLKKAEIRIENLLLKLDEGQGE